MVAEPRMLKMGNQVSNNLKHSLHLKNSTKSTCMKQGPQERQTIGILSFEVANVMSKIIHLHKSLTDNAILKLKNEIFKSKGIKTLVSSDENQLLELALAEKLDDLNRVASVVSRLGKKCTVPALQGFEHVYGDIVSGVIDIKELSFLVKDMERMVRKMEQHVNSTASLYSELEVMNELEVATKKFERNQLEETRKAFEQKLMWQKQDVRHLKDVSLWNQTYDKVVELLARTVCTIFARIYTVSGDKHSSGLISNSSVSRSQVGFSRRVKWDSEQKSSQLSRRLKWDSGQKSSQLDAAVKIQSKNSGHCHSGSIVKEDLNFVCGRLFMECISASKVDNGDHVSYDDQRSQVSGFFSASSGVNRDQRQSNGNLINCSKFAHQSWLLAYAPPSTLCGSALALHYANVVIVLEKLLRYPHLVGDEARDDLYQMLPTSLRKTLKTSLKPCVKELAIYDAPLAHDWKERLDSMLKWLAPLANNMITWQSERNFEQHQIVKRTNILLVQTLYFADQEKTEAAICELLVGLNYICRYEQQQNALLDCESSFDFEDCMRWQSQARASFNS